MPKSLWDRMHQGWGEWGKGALYGRQQPIAMAQQPQSTGGINQQIKMQMGEIPQRPQAPKAQQGLRKPQGPQASPYPQGRDALRDLLVKLHMRNDPQQLPQQPQSALGRQQPQVGPQMSALTPLQMQAHQQALAAMSPEQMQQHQQELANRAGSTGGLTPLQQQVHQQALAGMSPEQLRQRQQDLAATNHQPVNQGALQGMLQGQQRQQALAHQAMQFSTDPNTGAYTGEPLTMPTPQMRFGIPQGEPGYNRMGPNGPVSPWSPTIAPDAPQAPQEPQLPLAQRLAMAQENARRRGLARQAGTSGDGKYGRAPYEAFGPQGQPLDTSGQGPELRQALPEVQAANQRRALDTTGNEQRQFYLGRRDLNRMRSHDIRVARAEDQSDLRQVRMGEQAPTPDMVQGMLQQAALAGNPAAVRLLGGQLEAGAGMGIAQAEGQSRLGVQQLQNQGDMNKFEAAQKASGLTPAMSADLEKLDALTKILQAGQGQLPPQILEALQKMGLLPPSQTASPLQKSGSFWSYVPHAGKGF